MEAACGFPVFRLAERRPQRPLSFYNVGGGGTETATEVTAGVSLAPVNWEPLRGREPLASLSRLLGGRRSACVTNGRTKASPHLQGPSRPSCLW